ncbi:hypothetical protein LSH36_221g03004 [Paralvinella palmiformis]|uniref:Uncharacterized protein n=1 Tax=Paralvinella palmiformis TaxID=53620 RepID=A0AAD9JQ78_9ANNE|nr:hypothetical protein LSH36_221g03004 [Paralvinella palmiformis]
MALWPSKDIALTLVYIVCAELARRCSGLECKVDIKHPPTQHLSLCSGKQLTLSKISLLPHVNCTCILLIPPQNGVRIAVKTETRQYEASRDETFVIYGDNTRSIHTAYDRGSCQEYHSATQPLAYTISYQRDASKTKPTSLQLWIEALPDANKERLINDVSLQCGLHRLPDNGKAVKMTAFVTTSYWKPATFTGKLTTKPNGRTSPVYLPSVGISTSPSEKPPGSKRTASASPTLPTVTNRTDNPQSMTTPTNGSRNDSQTDIIRETSPCPSSSTGDTSTSYLSELTKNKTFVLIVSISLSLMVLIMALTGAVSYVLFNRKKRQRTGSCRRILKADHKYGTNDSYDEEHQERSDYGSVFRVTGTNASEVRFQY